MSERLPSNKLRLVAASVLVVVLSHGAHAQFFHDDFEDGSITDGSPVTWVAEVAPFPVGDARVQTGSLVLTAIASEFFPNFWETDWEVEQEFPADVAVRTQVRALSAGVSYQGIYARDTHNVNARQGASVAAIVASTGLVRLYRVVNSVGTVLLERSVPALGSLANDIHLELELIGPQASVYAWADGDARPALPLLHFSDVGSAHLTPGRVGVFAGQEDVMPFISSAFRFVEVSPIPEPNSLTMAIVFFASLIVFRRQQRNMFSGQAT
jgi:hypothetical protein